MLFFITVVLVIRKRIRFAGCVYFYVNGEWSMVNNPQFRGFRTKHEVQNWETSFTIDN
jgi:hypothetical protein